MSRLNPKLNDVVAGEIAVWRSEELIGEELASILLARYPAAAPSSAHITALTILGGVLLGLGTLLFVASNWAAMPALLKLLVIMVAMIGFYVTGWRFKYEPGTRPRVGTAMILVGTIIYGAGVWLISQTYNMDLSLSNGFLLWALGAAGLAAVMRCSVQSILACILIMGWAVVSQWSGDFLASNNPNLDILGVTVLGAFAACAALSRWTRSAASMALSAVAAGLSLLMVDALHLLLPWSAVLVGSYFFLGKRVPGLKPLLITGTVGLYLSLLALTFGSYSSVSPTMFTVCFCLSILVALAVAALQQEEFKYEYFALACFSAVPWLCSVLPTPLQRFSVNVILFGFLLGLMLLSQRKFKEAVLVNLSVGGIVIFLICRYFDFFFSMLDRSIVFTLGGVLLLVIGSFAERGRRKLLGGLQ